MKEFFKDHWFEILWALIFAVLIEIIFKPIRHWREQSKKLKVLFSFIGKSSTLKPDDLIGNRPYNHYYYVRKEDDLIQKCLNSKGNLLIVGSP